ncbi:MAG: hypothetical protein QM770_11885 [Tepidisphaeraceae bacterium]
MVLSADVLRLARHALKIDLPAGGTRALNAARANYTANRSALLTRFPRVAACVPVDLPIGEFVYARDGSLTARPRPTDWLAGCSVPRLVARRALQKTDLHGLVACMLAPMHAQEIVCAFEKLQPHQGMIVVQPALQAVAPLFACADFSQEINAGRLFPVVGPAWEREFDKLFETFDTLVPPTQLLRLPLAPGWLLERLTGPVERVVQAQLTRHVSTLNRIASRPAFFHRTGSASRLVVLGDSRCTPWRDSGCTLLKLATGAERVDWLDASSTLQASPLALARQAQQNDAIMTADVGRGDLPAVAPLGMPWITWSTQGRIPTCIPNATRDRLILIDDALRRSRTRLTGLTRESRSPAVQTIRVQSIETRALPSSPTSGRSNGRR